MIGQMLASYEILSKIGAGGMGKVYRARDTRLDREVALKVLPASSRATTSRPAPRAWRW
jgi:serine/threonine protein kinase